MKPNIKIEWHSQGFFIKNMATNSQIDVNLGAVLDPSMGFSIDEIQKGMDAYKRPVAGNGRLYGVPMHPNDKVITDAMDGKTLADQLGVDPRCPACGKSSPEPGELCGKCWSRKALGGVNYD